MADIKITLETLYDLLRNEKKREDLQKLDATFFLDVLNYLREKQVLLESKQQSAEIFAAAERDKLDYELRSIRRILKDLYERREKKVLEIALNKSRTGSDIIDISAMLYEEKEFYQKALKIMNEFRQGILGNLLRREMPKIPEQTTLVASPAAQAEGTQATLARSPARMPSMPPPAAMPATEMHATEESHQAAEGTEQKTKIKFVHPLPSFVWKDMKVYGPFDTGEETEIYPEVAELIVKKGRAVRV